MKSMNKYAYLYTSLVEALVKQAAVENRYVQPGDGNPLTNAWNTAQNAIGDATTGWGQIGKNLGDTWNRAVHPGTPYAPDVEAGAQAAKEDAVRRSVNLKAMQGPHPVNGRTSAPSVATSAVPTPAAAPSGLSLSTPAPTLSGSTGATPAPAPAAAPVSAVAPKPVAPVAAPAAAPAAPAAALSPDRLAMFKKQTGTSFNPHSKADAESMARMDAQGHGTLSSAQYKALPQDQLASRKAQAAQKIYGANTPTAGGTASALGLANAGGVQSIDANNAANARANTASSLGLANAGALRPLA